MPSILFILKQLLFFNFFNNLNSNHKPAFNAAERYSDIVIAN